MMGDRHYPDLDTLRQMIDDLQRDCAHTRLDVRYTVDVYATVKEGAVIAMTTDADSIRLADTDPDAVLCRDCGKPISGTRAEKAAAAAEARSMVPSRGRLPKLPCRRQLP
jgi:hypothetical protein